MWGLPGSMLACIFMDWMTGETRWRTLFVTQAARLFGELEDTDLGPLWTQDLYGARERYLGDRGWPPEAAVSEDAFDAAVSALVMSAHATALAALPPEPDPVLRREGRIWSV